MTDVTYRFFRPSDIIELVSLRLEYFRETSNAPIPEEIAPNTCQYLEEELASGTLVGVVAILRGQIVGHGFMFAFSIMPTRRNLAGMRGYLFNFYVRPEFRRQGIATEILCQLKEEARRLGIHDLFLNAREMAIPLYEQNGFQFLWHEMKTIL